MTPRPPKAVPPRAQLKTYSHLMGERRIPSEYDVVTSRLLFHETRDFAVATPLGAFYRTHQRESPLCCDDWEAFRDPRQTTYFRYTTLMSEREAFVAHLFQRIEESDYDARLSPDALALHEQLLAPLRYPVHGLQMATAYVGQLAPSGRIVVVCALQVGDELRRVQHLAYRLALVRRRRPRIADESRARWQTDPLWQPLRRVIEALLVTWDWGEAFVALCLCIKPVFDALIYGELTARLDELGDHLTSELLGSLAEDARWHRAWATALLEMALARRPENVDPLRAWAMRWSERALEAAQPLLAALSVSDDRVRAPLQSLQQALEVHAP